MKIEKIRGVTAYKKNVILGVTKLVCSEYSIKYEDIFTKSRAYIYSVPRMVAVGLLRNVFHINDRTLSDYFGFVSHSSIYHASKSLDERVKTDPEIAVVVASVLKQFKTLIPNPVETAHEN